MSRDGRPLHLLAFLGVGLVITLALVGVDRWFVRPRPTELLPDPAANRSDPPPWMKCLYLEAALMDAPGLRVVHPDPSGVCYVFDGPADLAALDGLRPEEEYADCWRGVLLCVADPPEHAPGGDHGCHAGDFYLFGDVGLLERVRRTAEMVDFGPYRGTGR
jgi:hypothetical protein